MSHATFTAPDLTTFARLEGLGLAVVGQRVEPTRAVLACRVVEPDQWCGRCGCEGGPYPRILDTGCDYAAVGSVAARRAS